MKNCIGGEIKEMSKAEFLALFDPSVHAAIEKSVAVNQATAVVCYENLQLDSLMRGFRSALTVGGPASTYTLEQAAAHHLGSVPSRFQYPVAFMRV